MKTYLLTSQELLAYSPLATVSCSRDWHLVDTKACTALIKRIFYARNLSVFYGSVRGRTARFAVSFVAVMPIPRMLSPLFGINGGSQSKITKGDCECLIHYR